MKAKNIAAELTRKYGKKSKTQRKYSIISPNTTNIFHRLLPKPAKKLLTSSSYILAMVTLIFLPTKSFGGLTGSLAEDAIRERLKPKGEVTVSNQDQSGTAATVEKEKSAKSIYKDNCHMCHHSGLAGAPRWGKKADWTNRMDQGIDGLTDRAYKGFKAMPPKGNCISCSKEDIRKTVEYMLESLD